MRLNFIFLLYMGLALCAVSSVYGENGFFQFFEDLFKGNDEKNKETELKDRENRYSADFDTYSKIIKGRNDQIAEMKLAIREKRKTFTELKAKADKCFLKTSSCIPFGNSSGIHQISLPGIGSFDVLCNNGVAGPGWIVIQQRINGWEDFDRNWANYSTGFGSLDGDFFMGLEKIHRLTSAYRHELFIYVEDGNYQDYARYDRFEVAGEHDQYRLLSLGKWTPRKKAFFYKDNLRANEHKRFYTYDRDNDRKCSSKWTGGWWFDKCGYCNLNSQYNYIRDIEWGQHKTVSKVQMLIRAKAD